MGPRTLASCVLVSAPADAAVERRVALGSLERWNARYGGPAGEALVPVFASVGEDPEPAAPWRLLIGVIHRPDEAEVARLVGLARRQAAAGRPAWLFVADAAAAATFRLARELAGVRPRPLVASYGSPEQLDALLRGRLACR